MKIPTTILLITMAAAVSFGSLTEEYREAAAAVDANAASETRPSANETKLATVTETLLMKAPIEELRQVVGQLDVMSASSQQTLRKILELLRGRNSEIEISRFAAVLLASNDWNQDPKDDFPRGMIVVNNFRSTAGPLLMARIGLRDLPLGEKRLDLLLYHADQWLDFAFDRASDTADAEMIEQMKRARLLYSREGLSGAITGNGSVEPILKQQKLLTESNVIESGMSPNSPSSLAVWGLIGSIALLAFWVAYKKIVNSKR